MPHLRRPPLRLWVWTAASVALLLVAVLLWRGSDAALTDSTTSSPAQVPDDAPADELAASWTATGDLLPRRAVESGRVFVGDERGITALDAVTGDEAWHYTRANSRLCDLTAVDGVVVAVFRTADRCDEALALDAGTGIRRWTRNVNFRDDVRLSSTDQIVLAATGTGIVTLDPTNNGLRWNYQSPGGCRLLGADAGSTGVGILQRCSGSGAVQLRLFDGFEGDPHWTRDVAAPPDTPVRLVGVDRLVTVVVGDTLEVHGPGDGAVLSTFELPASDDDAEVLHQAAMGDLGLVWARGSVRALGADGSVVWEQQAQGLPSVREVDEVSMGAATVLVPEDGGFVRRDLATGEEVARLSVTGGLLDGGRTSVVGPVVVYRLPDRVLGYR
jgi:outer membrane protein assembly factor BamB